jgi:hypothetical protein
MVQWKILACDASGPEFKSRVLCLLLFQDDILGTLGSNLVFIIPFLLLFQDDILGSLGSNLVFIIPFGIT